MGEPLGGSPTFSPQAHLLPVFNLQLFRKYEEVATGL